jgi:hypothetical protein
LGFGGRSATLRGHGFVFQTASGGRFGIRNVGFAMSRFGYLRDRLFLVAATGYVINRWVLQPRLASPFLHGYFNDLLLIPAALPVVLWVQRVAGLRDHDRAPSWSEVALHLVAWSVICELIGPRWLHHGTADLWDVAAYTVGGVAAFLWWQLQDAKCPKTGDLTPDPSHLKTETRQP